MSDPKPYVAGLLELVDNLAFCFSLDGSKLFYFNEAAKRVYGEAGDALARQPGLWMELVHESDRERLQENIAKMPELESFEQKFRFHSNSGELRGVSGRFHVMKDDQGQPTAIGAILHDVTDRVKAERRFQESQAIYHALVESLPINVFRKDSQGRILFANQRFCKEVGLPLEKLLGKTDSELFGKEIGEKYEADDRHVIESGEIFHDIELHPGDGSVKHVEVLKAPRHRHQRSASWNPGHVLGCYRPGRSRAGVEACQRDRRERQSGEKRLPRERQPRNPDSDERHHWHVGVGAARSRRRQVSRTC